MTDIFLGWLNQSLAQLFAPKVVALEALADAKEPFLIAKGGDFPQNEKAYSDADIVEGRYKECKAKAIAALKHQARYEIVSEKSGVPWFVIAGLHRMESDQNWQACLHNGEKIIGTDKKTKLVPSGRGPFPTWEAAAIDALSIEWKPKAWDLGSILEFCERYNGLGYRKHGVKSPYVYGFTTAYTKGRYVKDGVWDANSIHKRPGIASMLKCLEDMGELKIV